MVWDGRGKGKKKGTEILRKNFWELLLHLSFYICITYNYCLISLLHREGQYPIHIYIPIEWHIVGILRPLAVYFHINFVYIHPALPCDWNNETYWVSLSVLLRLISGLRITMLWYYTIVWSKNRLEGRFVVCAWNPVLFLKPNSEVWETSEGFLSQWSLTVMTGIGGESLSPSHRFRQVEMKTVLGLKIVPQIRGHK